MLRPYKVTGWKQYMTNTATEVSRIQLAESPEDAVEQVTGAQIFNEKRGIKYVLTAKEIKPCKVARRPYGE